MSTSTLDPSSIQTHRLLECLDELPPDQRAMVVERHYVQPRGSWEDIARSLALDDVDDARRLYTEARIGLIRCWKGRKG